MQLCVQRLAGRVLAKSLPDCYIFSFFRRVLVSTLTWARARVSTVLCRRGYWSVCTECSVSPSSVSPRLSTASSGSTARPTLTQTTTSAQGGM